MKFLPVQFVLWLDAVMEVFLYDQVLAYCALRCAERISFAGRCDPKLMFFAQFAINGL